MPGTLLTKLTNANPNSAGLPAIARVSNEDALFAHAGVLRWWEARDGYRTSGLAPGWECRKSGARLIANTAYPTREVVAAYNGQVALSNNGSNNALDDGGQSLIPTGDFSWVMVGRANNVSAFMAGTLATASGDDSYLLHSAATTGGIQFRFTPATGSGGTTSSSSGTHPRFFADGPNLIIASRKKSNGHTNTRINRGAYTSGTGIWDAGEDIKIRNLVVNGSRNPPANGLGAAGDFAVFMVMNVPLLDAANAALLTLVETYLATKYGTP